MVAAGLTKTEAQILGMYSGERLTVVQIAARLRKEKNCIEVHLSHIRKKGYLNPAGFENLKPGGEGLKPLKESLKKWGDSAGRLRLDAQQWKIKLLWSSDKYRAGLAESNILPDFGGVYVVLYPDMIEAYSRTAFYGDTVDEVSAQAWDFWQKWAYKLESRLGVIIVKDGYRNWRLVKSGEYAREGSDVAIRSMELGEVERVRGADGKAWWVIDWSKGDGRGPEDEAVHPITSKADRGVVDHYLNDFRDHRPLNNSEIVSLIREHLSLTREAAFQNKETAAGLCAVVQLMRPSEPPKIDGVGVRPWYVG